MPKLINRSTVGEFIKNKLRDKLRDDLLNIKIIKESDLQCCIYYHLRNFLQQDTRWKISTRIFVPHTGKFPDIILFKKDIPKIGIELKWNKKSLGKKDRKSLHKLLEIGVNKVYYINVMIDKKFEETGKSFRKKQIF